MKMITKLKEACFARVLFVNKVLADHEPGHVSTDSGGSTDPPATVTLNNPLRFGSLEEILDAIAGFLFRISIPLVVIFIIIGAFQLLTARGNPENISKGRKTITWAVIGFVVILLAASIAALIKNFLAD